MKWIQIKGKCTWGLTGDLVDFIILSGWFQPEFQTEKAEVYREDRYECYRVGTELHTLRSTKKKRYSMENYSELQSPYQCCSNGVIDSMVNSMRELQDLYDIMMFFRNNTVANLAYPDLE
jgi:hypothetical protein